MADVMKFWKSALNVTGVAAIGAFVLYWLFKEIFNLDILILLGPELSFWLLVLLLILVFVLAMYGFHIYAHQRVRRPETLPSKLEKIDEPSKPDVPTVQPKDTAVSAPATIKIRDNEIYFDDLAVKCLQRLKLSKEDFAMQLDSEFKGHPIFGIMEYENTTLPLSSKLYAVVSKTKNKVKIEMIKEIIINDDRLVAWQNLSSDYLFIRDGLYACFSDPLLRPETFSDRLSNLRRLSEDISRFLDGYCGINPGPVLKEAISNLEKAEFEYAALDEGQTTTGSIGVKINVALSIFHKVIDDFGAP